MLFLNGISDKDTDIELRFPDYSVYLEIELKLPNQTPSAVEETTSS